MCVYITPPKPPLFASHRSLCSAAAWEPCRSREGGPGGWVGWLCYIFFWLPPPPLSSPSLLAVADSRCSERELGSPAGATWGRGQGKGTRAGTRSTQSLQDLAHSPARCWHIPRLSPGHLFQKNTFRTSSSLRIQHCEQLLARQKEKKKKENHAKGLFVREETGL